MRHSLYELNELNAKTGEYGLFSGDWRFSNGFAVSDPLDHDNKITVTYNGLTQTLSFDKAVYFGETVNTQGGYFYKSVLVAQPEEYNLTMADNITKVLSTGYINTVKELILNVRVSSPSNVSYIKVHVFHNGFEYVAFAGETFNHEFTQISFVYNNAESLLTGVHVVNIVGNGAGLALSLSIRAEIVNNVN